MILLWVTTPEDSFGVFFTNEGVVAHVDPFFEELQGLSFEAVEVWVTEMGGQIELPAEY